MSITLHVMEKEGERKREKLFLCQYQQFKCQDIESIMNNENRPTNLNIYLFFQNYFRKVCRIKIDVDCKSDLQKYKKIAKHSVSITIR